MIGFRLPTRDAVDETYADLIAHEHQGLQPPYDVFWGSRYAIVEDPDGNPVGLMSPADGDHRSAPPDLERASNALRRRRLACATTRC